MSSQKYLELFSSVWFNQPHEQDKLNNREKEEINNLREFIADGGIKNDLHLHNLVIALHEILLEGTLK